MRGKPLSIDPGKGIGPFQLGLTRDQVQALTREPILSYYPQSWSVVRSDSHEHLGVTVSYDDAGRANHIAGYTRIANGVCTLELAGERLRDATRQSLGALLDVLDCAWEDTGETLVAPALGLTFGFREPDAGDGYAADDRCDWVIVRAAPGPA